MKVSKKIKSLIDESIFLTEQAIKYFDIGRPDMALESLHLRQTVFLEMGKTLAEESK